ncbi:hypothetical protein KC318_g6307 [Hortaea werneckii]|nr:hypothetical protein KC334_g5103 [Hortaea werneckii]KAI7023970.1 hypothetical protein KC355_g1562 [Hortaea werneckii]KAI7666766.1 hypothetical protein KC318_g6307 [Hortaea werneckii]
MANFTQLSVMVFVLLFTSSAHALFCKEATPDCKCQGLVPPSAKCTSIDPANSTCYTDGYAPNLDTISMAIWKACDRFQNPHLRKSLVGFYNYRYSPAEDADEGTISLAVMWWGTDHCAGSTRDPKVAFPLRRETCEFALRSLVGPEIGYKYFRPGLCASRGGTGTDWCWTYSLDSSPRKHGFWALLVRDALDRAQDWAGLQEWANSPAGNFLMLGHEEERPDEDYEEELHDDEYEDELQALANEQAGSLMIVAREEEVKARHDDEYEDKIQALANEQAGSLMIVARDDDV